MFADGMMMNGALGVSYQITNSLLFRGGQHFGRTPSTSANAKLFTFSAWVRRGSLGSTQKILSGSDAGYETTLMFNSSDQLEFFSYFGGGYRFRKVTNMVFRDIAGFMHIVAVLDGAGGYAKIYVTGTEVTSFAVSDLTYINENSGINNGTPMCIGKDGAASSGYFSGYLTEVILVGGVALTPSSFGETDLVTGSWRPKKTSGLVYGTNGFHLGAPWNSASLGTDYSGLGNNWTPNGFVSADVVTDSPTNVFATLNPLDKGSDVSLSNGNITWSLSGTTSTQTRATYPVSSGKWRWEVKNVGTDQFVGVEDVSTRAFPSGTGFHYGDYSYSAGSYTTVELDMTTTPPTITYYVGGVQRKQANLTAGATYRPSVALAGAGGSGYQTDFNFGQVPFQFQPGGAGFKTICTANLPATTGQTSGSFTGDASTNGPCIHTGAVPLTLTINGNSVTWGTHADKLATGFKIRTSSASYNSTGTNTWVATYSTPQKPTIGTNHVPANAQGNP